eukprot:754463-Hanusia_phi.AAC.2
MSSSYLALSFFRSLASIFLFAPLQVLLRVVIKGGVVLWYLGGRGDFIVEDVMTNLHSLGSLGIQYYPWIPRPINSQKWGVEAVIRLVRALARVMKEEEAVMLRRRGRRSEQNRESRNKQSSV